MVYRTGKRTQNTTICHNVTVKRVRGVYMPLTLSFYCRVTHIVDAGSAEAASFETSARSKADKTCVHVCLAVCVSVDSIPYSLSLPLSLCVSLAVSYLWCQGTRCNA
jgi:hypothetical protein